MVDMEEPNKQCGKLLMEVERFDGKAKEEDQEAVALVLDLAKAFGRVSLCGLGLGNTLRFPKEGIAGAVWLLRAPEASAVRRMCGRAAQDHHGHLARVKVELLALAYCTSRCAE